MALGRGRHKQAHALEAKQADKAVIVALVSQDVVAVHTIVVDAQLVENHIAWRAHLEREVHGNVLVTEVARARQVHVNFQKALTMRYQWASYPGCLSE